jgi:hypothetical protein
MGIAKPLFLWTLIPSRVNRHFKYRAYSLKFHAVTGVVWFRSFPVEANTQEFARGGSFRAGKSILKNNKKS